MDSRTYYYARVSSKEQNLARQLAAFEALGASERDIITDKESGKDLERKGYQALKSTILRRGDTLVIKSLDRLSRNKMDIRNELQYFKENGIRLRIIDLPTTMMELPEGQEWVFDMGTTSSLKSSARSQNRSASPSVSGSVRALMQPRQRGNTSVARSSPIPPNWKEVYAEWRSGGITAKVAMQKTGLKRTSFYKLAGKSR